jgi:hypothetical protein
MCQLCIPGRPHEVLEIPAWTYRYAVRIQEVSEAEAEADATTDRSPQLEAEEAEGAEGQVCVHFKIGRALPVTDERNGTALDTCRGVRGSSGGARNTAVVPARV